MTGTTISGMHLGGVTLSNPPLQNPATVAIGATIQAIGGADSYTALFGLAGAAWIVVNDGLIDAPIGPGTGIRLSSGGVILNDSTGTIYGSGHGVDLDAGGTVFNQGTISAGSATVNPGALYVLGGGYITNQSGGVISAASTGILGLGSGSLTVANQGGITTTSNGIYIDGGGSVTNQSGGVIDAGGNGIELLVTASNTGFVTNQSGGTILAGNHGIYVSGGTAVNQGFISASSDGLLLIGGSSGTNETGGTISAAGFGVMMDGGVFTNESGATISGTGNAGIKATGAATVVNAGLIDPATYGAYLSAGGTVTNVSGGTIVGTAAGVKVSGAPGTVINAGSLYATDPGSSGVALISGGTVTNQYGGTIDGALYGVDSSNAATVTNYGQIGGTAAFGIGLASGLVTNAGTATITGSNGGVRIFGVGTVVNAGTITGGGDAVYFHPGFAASLVIDPGAVFNGAVDGGNTVGATAISTLELASGAATGVLAGFGTQFVNFAQVTVDVGAQWTLQSTDLIEAGVTLTNAGTIGGTVTLAAYGVLSNTSTGTVVVPAGVAVYGATGGTATVVNAGVIADADATGGQGIFLSGGGTVTNQGGGTISGYQAIYGSTGAPLAVVNAGTVYGLNGDGIRLLAGGYVTNQSDGSISGYQGITGKSTAVTVVNDGSIAATGMYGTAVNLFAGGYLTNQSDGSVTGSGGIYGGAVLTVTNAGTITATGPTGVGIAFDSGGSVTNQSGGLVSGYRGIYGGNGVSLLVVNAGTITGSGNDGVLLTGGGYVTNASSGTISGYTAIFGRNTALTVVNAGSIVATGSYNAGVFLQGGGSLTNQIGGTITGYSGVYGEAPLIVMNYGAISGSAGAGVSLYAGGSVTNQSGGTISGAAGIASNGTLTAVNYGVISAASSAGIGLQGGYVTNQSGGTISGYIGIAGGPSTTVVNAGDITGYGHLTAGVLLADGGSLNNQNGGVIRGYNAVYGQGTPITVVNAGTIAASGRYGVLVLAGGYVTNQSGGTISGYTGIYSDFAVATVVNAGSIQGSTTSSLGGGIVLLAGGYVSNQIDGTIGGAAAIYAKASLTLVNAGTIAGNFGGVGAASGGTITNQGSGTISGTVAVYARFGALTVVNDGSILGGMGGTYQGGAVLMGGGGITNQSGGTIVGYDAIYGGKYAGLTVVNAGSITGTGAAVQFVAGYMDLLVVDPTGMFNGIVDGGNIVGATAVSTLELAAGLPGTLSGIGTQFVNFVQTTIDAGADWTLTGATFAAGTTLTNAGTLTVPDTTLFDAGLVINNGAILIDPSTVTLTDLAGMGSVTIDDGSTLDIFGTVSVGETIVFSNTNDLLRVNPTAFAGQINGFTAGDTIELTGVTDGFSPEIVNGNTLEIQRTGNPAVDLTLDPTVDYTGAVFAVDSAGDVTEAPCFLRDTRIRTATGDVMVQDLRIGDRVETLSGQLRPITWIGTGQVLVSPGRRCAATPIVVRKSALTDGVPYYDLRITKGHSLFVDGVLIPVEFLINHRSIQWDDHKREVEFYHIECETHEVLIANGAPSESYRDDGNRWLFRNANSGWDQAPKPPCALVLTGGPIVDAIWQRLLERTNRPRDVALTEDADLHLLVDGVRVDPASQHGATNVFRLARRPDRVRVVSRAAAPAELGLGRDPRRLGVAVMRITLGKGPRLRVIEAEDPSLTEGFHAFEAALGVRWTDGDAILPAALFEGFEGMVQLALHLRGSTRYPAFFPAVAPHAA